MPGDLSEYTPPSGEAPHVLRHKLRSPLTVIIAYADTLISESESGIVPRDRLIERLGRMRTAAGRIAHLLDELDLAAERDPSG
jgi:signal transduction histidine kinase